MLEVWFIEVLITCTTGLEVLLDNEEVDRKALGRIVFADKVCLCV